LIPVTQQFKDAIYSPSRKTAAKVIFDILDVDSHTDATASVTSESSFSKKSQIFNQVREMSGKLATLEHNYWKLDGSFSLPPKPEETGFEVGWWSDALCGPDGRFGNYVEPLSFLSFGSFVSFFDDLPMDEFPQSVTVNFTKDHSSIGITITFDPMTNEYAEEFTIDVYDSSNALIHSETVAGNTLTKYILEQNLSNFRKVVITITKWGTGYRRARITEVDFGIITEYTGNELINLNVLEELDPISNTVTSNELKFTVDNQDKAFNILNPNGIYPFLQRRQKVMPYMGVEKANGLTEYVKMGVYYLNEWKSNEGTLTASFTARDIMDVLAQDDFAGNTYTSKTLYYIAEEILTAAGITDYSIDIALQSIVVTGSIAKMKYRESLQFVVIAGTAVIYSDRVNGKVIIEQLSSVALEETIDFDNVYNPPEIKLDTLVNTIYIDSGSTIYTYVDPQKPVGEQTLSVSIKNTLITNSTLANTVATWILTEYKKRFLYEINWRMNPALEVGNIVTVEDEFGENKTVRITKQEFEYAGYLSGKTNGKGGGA